MIKCPDCSAEYQNETLMCSNCGSLLWKEKLKELFELSKNAEAENNWESCLILLSQCLKLLPPDSLQYKSIQQKIAKIIHTQNNQKPEINQASLEAPHEDSTRNSSFYKVVMSAFKNLFLGLLKPRTFISLVIWVVAFSFVIGWKKSLILAILLYIHEMGHIIAIQYYGYRYAWPVFVPFLGAFVLKGKTSEERHENLIISFAGSGAGLLFGAFILLINIIYPLPLIILKMNYLNILINFLNLAPLWILDGARMGDLLQRKHFLWISAGLIFFTLFSFNIYSIIMAGSWIIKMIINWNNKARMPIENKKDAKYVSAVVIITILTLTACSVYLKVFTNHS